MTLRVGSERADASEQTLFVHVYEDDSKKRASGCELGFIQVTSGCWGAHMKKYTNNACSLASARSLS